jgi:predicted ATP-dependent endonuclease of OLD family
MIDKLEIKNFTVFETADLPFCKGINVIIGENVPA